MAHTPPTSPDSQAQISQGQASQGPVGDQAMVDALVTQLDDTVRGGLELAERRGMIGGDLTEHIRHAAAFVLQWTEDRQPETMVDLGSGGGLPGLVVADLWPTTRVILAETRQKRADTLYQAVRKAGWDPRVTVWAQDVQGAAVDHRAWADVVTARLFASPSMTAECAAPLLKLGGWLVVSEPPATEDRWNRAVLTELGLSAPEYSEAPYRMARFQKIAACPARYPRTRRAMDKGPLW